MSKHDWSGEMMQRLAELHADASLGFTGIAKIMSEEFHIRLSKNACIGKARRLALPMRGAIAVRTVMPKPRKSRARQRPAEPIAVTPRINPGWTIETPRIADGNRLTIYQLCAGVCHYPFGERPPYVYCGRPAPHTSWCPHHENIVYPRGRTK
jgi:hypothetical protein